jgi:hypothetical protein
MQCIPYLQLVHCIESEVFSLVPPPLPLPKNSEYRYVKCATYWVQLVTTNLEKLISGGKSITMDWLVFTHSTQAVKYGSYTKCVLGQYVGSEWNRIVNIYQWSFPPVFRYLVNLIKYIDHINLRDKTGPFLCYTT